MKSVKEKLQGKVKLPLSKKWDDTWRYDKGDLVEFIRKDYEDLGIDLFKTVWVILAPDFEYRDVEETYYVEPWKGDPRYDKLIEWTKKRLVVMGAKHLRPWISNKQTFTND